MTRDDIISMAREAGFNASVEKTDRDGKYHPNVNALSKDVPVEWIERLVAIASAAEREACVKACKAQRQLLVENEAKIGGLAIAMCVDAISTRGQK